jgi:uncharacterized protein (TIGR00730 family)
MADQPPPTASAPSPASTPSNSLVNICVYCGSGDGKGKVYLDAADALGRDMAKRGIGLVYGGGSLGLMGQVARGVLGGGGRVTGIIPHFLQTKEKMLKDVQELILVDDMHERKKLMFERADAFVALPGGIGTLEELVEQLTWAQLGRHNKPIVLANINGFWSPFMKLLSHMRDESFIRQGLEVKFVSVDKVEDIIPAALAVTSTDPADAATVKKILARF